MTTLDEKRVDWLYEHFQAISKASDRYMASFFLICLFSLAVFIDITASFKVPFLDLNVPRDLILGGCVFGGAFLFIAFSGAYDKGEQTLIALCSALSCDYEHLDFVDTHPTAIDFARYRIPALLAKRGLVARCVASLLYPIALLCGLAWLTALWGLQVVQQPLQGISVVVYLLAGIALYVGFRRAVPFLGRRWRTFVVAERARKLPLRHQTPSAEPVAPLKDTGASA